VARCLGVVLALVIACGGVTRPVPTGRYRVTAPLMIVPGKQPLTACRLIPLSMPPPACDGVEVRGVDAQRVPGARRLSNGATMTDPVRIVGRWDGTALTLTEPPRPDGGQSSAGAPRRAADPTPRATAALQRVAADEQELRRLGVDVLECSVDGDAVVLVVPVADQRTVQTLERRYGSVHVTGWLQPV
jgi:hypothetical protein